MQAPLKLEVAMEPWLGGEYNVEDKEAKIKLRSGSTAWHWGRNEV